MSSMWIIFTLQIASVVAIAACALGLIRVNHLVGVRTRAVMESQETWKAGHRAALIPMIVALILSSIFVALVYANVWVLSGTGSALIVVAMTFIGVIAGGMVATRASRRKSPSTGRQPR